MLDEMCLITQIVLLQFVALCHIFTLQVTTTAAGKDVNRYSAIDSIAMQKDHDRLIVWEQENQVFLVVCSRN